MAVYPGTDPTLVETVDPKASNVLSRLRLTSHAGTHVDAPSHSLRGTATIDQLPLASFYGPCRVLDLTKVQVAISIDDLKACQLAAGERILFKTSNSARGYDTFYDDYVYLMPEAAKYLADQKVALVGIDSLSIKQRGQPDNTAHVALLSHNIPILEGVHLANVTPGKYTLAAFPLALTGLDGAPTRAVLINDGPGN